MEWFEIVEAPSIDKNSARVSHPFNQKWPRMYPMPKRVRFDNIYKLKNNFIPLVKDFTVKPKHTSITPHPQSNVIVKNIHQVVGYILRTHALKDHTFDEIDPWGSILRNIDCKSCSTYHTTNQASSG